MKSLAGFLGFALPVLGGVGAAVYGPKLLGRNELFGFELSKVIAGVLIAAGLFDGGAYANTLLMVGLGAATVPAAKMIADATGAGSIAGGFAVGQIPGGASMYVLPPGYASGPAYAQMMAPAFKT
jgi:hypothetical protein